MEPKGLVGKLTRSDKLVYKNLPFRVEQADLPCQGPELTRVFKGGVFDCR